MYTQPGAAIDADRRRGGRHPLAQLLVDVLQFGPRVVAFGGACGKRTRQLGKPLAVRLVGEHGLVRRDARHERRRRQPGLALVARIQPGEGLLGRLARARDRRAAQPDVRQRRAVQHVRQKPKLLDVQPAQALAERQRRLTALDRQLAILADAVVFPPRAGGQRGAVVVSDALQPAPPRQRVEPAVRFADHGFQAVDAVAVRPVRGEAGVREACVHGRAFAVAEDNLHLLQFQSTGVFLGDLFRRGRGPLSERRHDGNVDGDGEREQFADREREGGVAEGDVEELRDEAAVLFMLCIFSYILWLPSTVNKVSSCFHKCVDRRRHDSRNLVFHGNVFTTPYADLHPLWEIDCRLPTSLHLPPRNGSR